VVDEPLVLDSSVKANRLHGVRRRPVAADAHTWLTDYFHELFGSPAKFAVPPNNRLSGGLNTGLNAAKLIPA
jgi:hypothetical protein